MSDSNYKEGLKGTSIFGSVGIFNIIITVIKSKLIAVFLGPEGMGILGLFNSATNLILSISNLGLRTSAVKDISEANATGDINTISRVAYVFKRLVWLTGWLGTGLFILASPFISKSSFGNYDYIPQLILLSFFLLFSQLLDGTNVLMQGTRRLKDLAFSNLLGSLISLICVVPLYYFGGIGSIAPTIVLGIFIQYAVSYYYAHKIQLQKVTVSLKECLIEGKGMVKLGFFIALNSVFTSLSAYIIRSFISNVNGIVDVGLYTAGFNIVIAYTGIVFNAMATEYYPRLASFSSDNNRVSSAVNSQVELTITLVAPLVCLFLVFGNFAVLLLYSDKFLGCTWMINFAMIGMFFKSPGWCLGYVFLAKGDSKAFFYNEIATLVFSTLCNMLFYYKWGLTGLGISYIVIYFVYWMQQLVVCRWLYKYSFDVKVLKAVAPHFMIALLCCWLMVQGFIPQLYVYLIGGLFVLISCYISYLNLQRNVDIKGFIQSKFFKK